ncbi:MAG: 30S ribosome-binding factor RbfA [Geodermatophilaceae bacterium]|nr:30S ribosome-binding factor RbfA [Geodermatophilaceae bacterium]
MADPARARRLAVRIREIVASTLEHQVKDPRLGMVTITDAKVTGDLREASVYYTVYGDDAEVTGSAIALESARGVLRSAVGKQTGIKFVPTLTFVSDAIPKTAQDIEDALARAREIDAEVAAKRHGAAYAGDADPYRQPRADEAEEADDPDEADRVTENAE